MKDIKWYRAWDIVYPVGIYYVLMNVATFVVCLIVPLTDESYGFIKVLTTLFVLPVVYVMYRNDQLRRGVQKAKAEGFISRYEIRNRSTAWHSCNGSLCSSCFE